MQKELKTTQAQRRASLKWEQANTDKITLKFRRDAIQAAAARSGQSVNAWILDAIRDAL